MQDPRQQQYPAPPAARTAIRLMYAGAAISALSIVTDLATVGAVRAAVVRSYPHLSSGGIHRVELVTLGGALVAGLVAVGLWLCMARATIAGQRRTRPAALVLFALNTLALLSTFIRPHTSYELIDGTLTWLAGLGATVLLWHQHPVPVDSTASAATFAGPERQQHQGSAL